MDDDDNQPDEVNGGPGQEPGGTYRRPQRPTASDWGFIDDLMRPLDKNDSKNNNESEIAKDE